MVAGAVYALDVAFSNKGIRERLDMIVERELWTYAGHANEREWLEGVTSRQNLLKYRQGGNKSIGVEILLAICERGAINPKWLLFEEGPIQAAPPAPPRTSAPERAAGMLLSRGKTTPEAIAAVNERAGLAPRTLGWFLREYEAEAERRRANEPAAKRAEIRAGAQRRADEKAAEKAKADKDREEKRHARKKATG